MATNGEAPAPTFDIPKECKAGVVVNEGPDFQVQVQNVPVPEISKYSFILMCVGPPQILLE
jgi:hypothetical protein